MISDMNELKTLTRIYCPSDLGPDTLAQLPQGPAHKLRAVLRAKIGDPVLLFNPQDGEWRATLTNLGKSMAQAECIEQTRRPQSEPGPWLAFAPLKKDRLDMVVEKAVELGVERLIPVMTARTQNHRLKMDRLRQQIIDASEQCERLSIPDISEPIALEKLDSVWPKDRALLVGAERQNAAPLADVLNDRLERYGLVIGPEGGFTSQELDWLANLPTSSFVSLGPRILRAETAAIAALTVVQSQCGDWRAS